MHRRDLLPALAAALKATSYLEIGVKGGKTMLPLRVRHKTAVDPNFRITASRRWKHIIKYPPNARVRYYTMTSDEFFAEHASSRLQEVPPDLAFVDGLHTYEQAYRDVINVLPYIKPGGAVLLHDCSPVHAASAFPAQSIQEARAAKPEGWDGRWSGDVWKTVIRLRSERPDLTVQVVDEDSGLGLITQKQATSTLSLTAAEIEDLTYEDLDANRRQWLNFTSVSGLLAQVQAR